MQSIRDGLNKWCGLHKQLHCERNYEQKTAEDGSFGPVAARIGPRYAGADSAYRRCRYASACVPIHRYCDIAELSKADSSWICTEDRVNVLKERVAYDP